LRFSLVESILLIELFSIILIVWFSLLIVTFFFSISINLTSFVFVIRASLILFLFLKSACFLYNWICFICVRSSWIWISSTFSLNKWIGFFFKRRLRRPYWTFIFIIVSRSCRWFWRLISWSFRFCVGIFCTMIILCGNYIIFIVVIYLLKVASFWSRILLIEAHCISNLILTWIIILLSIR